MKPRSAAAAAAASSKFGSAAQPASFTLWRKVDLPPEWQTEPSAALTSSAAARIGHNEANMASSVAIEAPDFPIVWSYQQWVIQQGDAEVLPCCIVSREDFARERGQETMAATLRTILEQGKPLLLPIRIWHPRT